MASLRAGKDIFSQNKSSDCREPDVLGTDEQTDMENKDIAP